MAKSKLKKMPKKPKQSASVDTLKKWLKNVFAIIEHNKNVLKGDVERINLWKVIDKINADDVAKGIIGKGVNKRLKD